MAGDVFDSESPEYRRTYLKRCVEGLALGPDDVGQYLCDLNNLPAWELMIGANEVQVHFACWRMSFTSDECSAIDAFINFSKTLPSEEDTCWEGNDYSTPFWNDARAQARQLIQSLGGLWPNAPKKLVL